MTPNLLLTFFLVGATVFMAGALFGAVTCWQIVKATHSYHDLIAVPKWALGIEVSDGHGSAAGDTRPVRTRNKP